MTRLEIGKRIGCRLRWLRNARGYALEDFADQLGMTKNNLYGIERGKRGALTSFTIVRFADALGVKPSDIVEALDR